MPGRTGSGDNCEMTAGALFLLALAAAVGALAFGCTRGWRKHRRSPAGLSATARRIWSRTGLRWSRPAYLTVHAVIGLVVTILAVVVFARLADWVTDQAAITRVDIGVARWLHQFATPAGVAVAKAVSSIG